MIRDLSCRIKDEWDGRGTFLGRGNFSELSLCIAETLTGIQILFMGENAAKQSMLLDRFDTVLPLWVVGLLWLVSGLLTLGGIILYLSGYRTTDGYRIERLLRFLGALGSIYVWVSATLILYPSPFMYIYLVASVMGMRVTTIVWHN